MEKGTFMEIGSIYEIDPGSVKSNDLEGTKEPVLPEINKYHKKNIAFMASGREAIAWALKSLETNMPGISKKCLMPAYMCDTVFYPFHNAGWELYFYHINEQMEAQEDTLRSLMKQVKPGLLFIHCYYGVDTWKPLRPLLKEWQSRGLFIMEDVTQSYYLAGAGREADYVIGSLRKWYPVPDGGFVASDLVLPHEELPVGQDFAEKRLKMLTRKWEYLYGVNQTESKPSMKADYLKQNKELEEWLDNLTQVHAISAISKGILRNEEESSCRRQRGANYKVLYDAIKNRESIRHPFSEPGYDAAPLYFPVYADDRDGLQEFLRAKDIYAPVLWPVGKQNAAYLSAEERYIFTHLLALPVDQRYGRKEMEKIAELVNSYEMKEIADQ